MAELTIDLLHEAVRGGAVALRSIVRLQPVDGPGGKVFPPTYAVNADHKYAVEERQVGDKVVTTVLLDSVASQANRAELALKEGWEEGELRFPVPFVDFSAAPFVDDAVGRRQRPGDGDLIVPAAMGLSPGGPTGAGRRRRVARRVRQRPPDAHEPRGAGAGARVREPASYPWRRGQPGSHHRAPRQPGAAGRRHRR